MIIHKKHSLVRVIGRDLLKYGKLQLSLLFIILVSAIQVVTTTYQTRELTIEYEKILMAQNVLNTEWHKLLLKENELGDHTRIEYIAIEKLRMQYLDPSQENIVVHLSTNGLQKINEIRALYENKK